MSLKMMSTLHEIAMAYAKKQPGMADSLTEDAPILNVVRWKPSTHGLWNVAEKLTDIEGPAFVEPDAPLPYMSTSSDLVHTDLHVLGGTIEVPTQRALKFGGPEKYFADRQNTILRKAGMDTEKQLVINNWLKAARACRNLKDAGGQEKGWWILAVRFDELLNVGLYDADQFEQGRLFRITLPYGGEEHHLSSGKYHGVLGYAIVYRANFGWQIVDPKVTCAAIVNIDEESRPTAAMIDDMLADVRAQAGSTYLFCSPKAKIYGINPYKTSNVELANSDTDAKTRVETWNGISIVTSHNFNDRINHVIVGA